MPESRSCVVCGIRPKELPGDINQMVLLSRLDDEIRRSVFQGYLTFQTGMDIGADIWAAEIVLRLKTQFPEITLLCRLPCETQANDWAEIWREKYFNVLSMADDVTCLSPRFVKGCESINARMMVDTSSRLISLCGGNRDRVFETVSYARKKGLEIKIVNPYNCVRGRTIFTADIS